MLAIQNLSIRIPDENSGRLLLDHVGFDIQKEEIFSLVGGSGSGKTTIGLAVLRLLSEALKMESGVIKFEGQDLLGFSKERMRALRGKEIGMVFQEPLHAFNPLFRVGAQIDEVLRFHTALSRKDRQERVIDLLRQVGIPDALRVECLYPHQLSGGMRQRAMIAQAIAASPKLLIADEPTSNLDVTLQAKIMDLFRKLKSELKISILLITHDLGLVKHLADKIAVLYEGKIVESGKIQEVMEHPKNDFTKLLLRTIT